MTESKLTTKCVVGAAASINRLAPLECTPSIRVFSNKWKLTYNSCSYMSYY